MGLVFIAKNRYLEVQSWGVVRLDLSNLAGWEGNVMSQTPYQSPTGGPSGPLGTVRLDVIGEAWNLYSKNFGPWIISNIILLIGAGVVYGIMWVVLMAVILGMANDAGFLSIFITTGGVFGAIAVTMAVVSFMVGGMMRMGINEARGVKAEVAMLFSETSRISDLIVSQLIVGIVGAFATACCYIPGLIWYALTMLTIPLIIDRRMPAMDAIKTSIETMKPQLGMGLLAVIVLAIINSFCSILTTPIVVIAVVLIYRDMVGFADGGPMATMAAPAPAPAPAPEAPAAPQAPVAPEPPAPAAPEATAQPEAPAEPQPEAPAPEEPAPPAEEKPPGDEQG